MATRRPLPIWAKLLLGAALGGGAFTLSASLFPGSDDAIVEPAAPRGKRTAAESVEATAPSPEASPAIVPTRLDTEVLHNPFGALNLQPPALASIGPASMPRKAAAAATRPASTPVAAVPPPAPPTAPPLPFVAIGSIEGTDATGGHLVAFLQQQETLLVVRKGESIGQSYRVEAITPDKVEFTYLPLNQRQSLSLVR